jgi:hypothetical protein
MVTWEEDKVDNDLSPDRSKPFPTLEEFLGRKNGQRPKSPEYSKEQIDGFHRSDPYTKHIPIRELFGWSKNPFRYYNITQFS